MKQQQLKSGGDAQDGQRRALIGALAQNNCGAQYASAAQQSGPANFFDALFGNGTIVNPSGDGAPSGTFHTVCVRTCDGYYFPISYSTNATRFTDDEKTCQRLCPASEAALYSFRNPGEGMDQAVSNTGQIYTALPNAYRYRKEVVAGCSCRRAGQSWADALKGADDSTTLEQGDIVVTDQNAKRCRSRRRCAAGPGARRGRGRREPVDRSGFRAVNDAAPIRQSASCARSGHRSCRRGRCSCNSSSRNCSSRSASCDEALPNSQANPPAFSPSNPVNIVRRAGSRLRRIERQCYLRRNPDESGAPICNEIFPGCAAKQRRSRQSAAARARRHRRESAHNQICEVLPRAGCSSGSSAQELSLGASRVFGRFDRCRQHWRPMTVVFIATTPAVLRYITPTTAAMKTHTYFVAIFLNEENEHQLLGLPASRDEFEKSEAELMEDLEKRGLLGPHR